jgi:OOP family OmpA-OmpF porin
MRRRLGLSLVVASLLVACSPGSDGDESAERDPAVEVTTTTEAAPDPEEVVGSMEAGLGPAGVAVEVHPLVRVDDVLVLTLDIEIDDAAEVFGPNPAGRLQAMWGSSSFLDLQEWVGLRLLDLEGARVVPPAVDASGDAVAVVAETDEDGTALRLQVAYGDPGVDEVALFVPQGGVVAGVPVIEADVPALGAFDPDDEEELDVAGVADPLVEPMVAYSVALDGTSRTEAQVEEVTIALGADVLFAVDSADLTPEAEGVIDAAVVELQARAPGSVAVVGHTDSTASDQYNLDLSQRRAEAVASALGERIDTAAYPLVPEGRGESEPVADNGDEEGRAANRRVELTLATEVVDEPAATTVEPIAFEGPTASGAEGVEVQVANRSYRVGAPRASVVDGHLVVEITTTATDDAVHSVSGPAIFEGRFPPAAGLDRLRTMAGVAVVTGSTAHLPVLHLAAAAESEGLVPLTDLVTFSRLDGGDTRTSALVYPRGVPVGETVTVQLVDLFEPADGWRLTDIPVEDG